ncbi:hypothetical protein GOODEAATRI_017293 [Goodea atripinnis]|uniref:rhomboid protease n=1 Tax=Goodea atripinnis TaxID=208336 RepID=A0ABV0PQ12_9TELE
MAWRSCSVLCRLTGGEPFLCSVRGGSRWPDSFQQRCGFKKAARKPEPKKPEDPVPAHTEPSEAVVQNQVPIQTPFNSAPTFSRLVRPFLFTVGAAPSAQQPSGSMSRSNLESRVTSTSCELIGWRRCDLRNEEMSARSHFSFFHMAANMYVLWSFSSSAVSMLGREQFMAVYLSADGHREVRSVSWSGEHGVSPLVSCRIQELLSYQFFPVFQSGAIMTVLAAVCTKIPEAKLAIIFLPMFTFTASNVRASAHLVAGCV